MRKDSGLIASASSRSSAKTTPTTMRTTPATRAGASVREGGRSPRQASATRPALVVARNPTTMKAKLT